MTVGETYGGDKLVEKPVKIDEIHEEEDLVSFESYEKLAVAVDLLLREEDLLLLLVYGGPRNLGI